ncbi:MAG: L-threonylcarbamoyladenylate synthase [bacterium]|nr:L-threonylcarbamoyladenylate synthase [bacterium]
MNAQSLELAVRLLRSSGIVAFPTETYYGLAVDPFNERALERLFLLKARPQAKPVLVLVRDASDIPLLATEIPELYRGLMQRFWPGPLTLIFPAAGTLPASLTAGTGGVGLRQSPHSVAARLLRAFGGPLTATSANRSGEAPATDARQALSLFSDYEGLVLDGGATPGGVGSTVAGLFDRRLRCLRPGKIPFSEVEASSTRLTFS